MKIMMYLLISFVIVSSYLVYQNNAIKITNIDYENELISSDLDGYKILQISDLHNKKFINGGKKVVTQIEDVDPDVIFITGDLIDSYNTDIDLAIDFVESIIDVAPIYYVNGNHESRTPLYSDLLTQLVDLGVHDLNDKTVTITFNDAEIDLIGISDPSFNTDNTVDSVANKIENLTNDNENLKILLSHRPELFEIYSVTDVDLVFSGHAHGGQIRIPFIGGIVAPNQGLFPKLTQGIQTIDDTSLIISRGIGNSIFPFRINNQPELVVTTLKQK